MSDRADKIHGSELNFDEWRELAHQDAEAFERRRREVLETFIAEAPAHIQPHLRRLQWRIDMDRRYRWRNPMLAAQRLYDMMWESVTGEQGLLPALERITRGDDGKQPTAKDSPRAATVLRMK